MLKFSNFSKNLTRSSSILYRNNFSYVTSIFDSYSLRKISKILKVPVKNKLNDKIIKSLILLIFCQSSTNIMKMLNMLVK